MIITEVALLVPAIDRGPQAMETLPRQLAASSSVGASTGGEALRGGEGREMGTYYIP